jgi:hypothetical protein
MSECQEWWEYECCLNWAWVKQVVVVWTTMQVSCIVFWRACRLQTRGNIGHAGSKISIVMLKKEGIIFLPEFWKWRNNLLYKCTVHATWVKALTFSTWVKLTLILYNVLRDVSFSWNEGIPFRRLSGLNCTENIFHFHFPSWTAGSQPFILKYGPLDCSFCSINISIFP